MQSPSITDYLSLLARPFFRAWWAAITGFASVLALFLTRDTSFVITGPTLAIAVLLVFAVGFILLSVVTQGWMLYRTQSRAARVLSVEKTREVTDGWMIVIESASDIAVGSVLDIHKKAGAIEVPFVLVEIVGRASDGKYQALPLSKLSPVHVREHTNGGLRPNDLVVLPFVARARVVEIGRV